MRNLPLSHFRTMALAARGGPPRCPPSCPVPSLVSFVVQAVQLTVAFQILDFQGPAASDTGPYAASSNYGGGPPSSFYNLDFLQVRPPMAP
jgi:hypothetical protein